MRICLASKFQLFCKSRVVVFCLVNSLNRVSDMIPEPATDLSVLGKFLVTIFLVPKFHIKVNSKAAGAVPVARYRNVVTEGTSTWFNVVTAGQRQ